MVITPVLFETFARPEYARKAFDAIKAAKPCVLYFYSNKARNDRPDEIKRNEIIRAFVSEIDWECDLHTFFRDEYVDVYTSLWGALDWFFNEVEEGIVLEEDCVASNAFFSLCDKLLPRYKNEPRVRLISGNNQTPEFNVGNCDYFFTRMLSTYGWASWSDRWKTLDREMNDWEKVKKYRMKDYYPHFIERPFQTFVIEKFYKVEAKNRSWDVIINYNMIKNNEVAIAPKYNLVDDIGYIGENHSVVSEKASGLPVFKGDDYPVDIYPSNFEPDEFYDYRYFKKNILKRFIIYEVKKIWHKLIRRHE